MNNWKNAEVNHWLPRKAWQEINVLEETMSVFSGSHRFRGNSPCIKNCRSAYFCGTHLSSTLSRLSAFRS